MIIGVGNAYHGMFIDGHSSRQDADSLRQLAMRIGGDYFDANGHHLPSADLLALGQWLPVNQAVAAGLRELALGAAVVGAALLTALGRWGWGTPGSLKDYWDSTRIGDHHEKIATGGLDTLPDRPAGVAFRSGPKATGRRPGGRLPAPGRGRRGGRAVGAGGAALPIGARGAARRTTRAATPWNWPRPAPRINAGEMIEGQEQLGKLLAKFEAGDEASPAGAASAEQKATLVEQATDELARSSYYAAWIMRLEGAAPDEWKPEAERARQQYRLLAERAADGNAADAGLFQRNLEATIRLEQMDLSTLLARPLPKKCCNCKNLSQRKRKQCQAQCKAGGKKEDKQDIRKVIKKQQTGAGINRREGTGS